MAERRVRMRLLHDGAAPVDSSGAPWVLGLQDRDDQILPGAPRPGGGLVFDFELRVKDGGARPNFLGPFASGPADDRFVYLSWRAKDGGRYINRLKCRLCGITWDQLRGAEAGGVLTADVTGRTPRDNSKPLVWSLEPV